VTTEGAELTLENLTLTNAKTTVDGSGGDCSKASGQGGTICALGPVTVTNSTISNNATTGKLGKGGRIYTDTGAITLVGTTISGNTLGGEGGGVYVDYGATIINSIISSNRATGGGLGDGGGIDVDSGFLTLINSTISGNTAGKEGGGVYSDEAITLISSTVSGNTAGEKGGGLYSDDNTFVLINSTVSGNEASSEGGGVYSDDALTFINSTAWGNRAGQKGGGVYVDNGSAVLTSSILAGNTVGGAASDCEVGGTSGTVGGRNNLIQVVDSTGICSLTHGTNNNIVGQDPMLGPLTDNGCVIQAGAPGSTACVQTHALQASSPAIDAGVNLVTWRTTDQRGRPREQDAAIDSGAFEVPVELVLTVPGSGSGDGKVTGNGLDCTLTAGVASGICTATFNQGSAATTGVAGSTFSGWTDTTCQGTTNPCTFDLTEAKTITAAFEKSQYTLTVTSGGSGVAR